MLRAAGICTVYTVLAMCREAASLLVLCLEASGQPSSWVKSLLEMASEATKAFL